MSNVSVNISSIYTRKEFSSPGGIVIYAIDKDGDAWMYFNVLPEVRAAKVILGMLERGTINPEYWNLTAMSVNSSSSRFLDDHNLRGNGTGNIFYVESSLTRQAIRTVLWSIAALDLADADEDIKAKFYDLPG